MCEGYSLTPGDFPSPLHHAPSLYPRRLQCGVAVLPTSCSPRSEQLVAMVSLMYMRECLESSSGLSAHPPEFRSGAPDTQQKKQDQQSTLQPALGKTVMYADPVSPLFPVRHDEKRLFPVPSTSLLQTIHGRGWRTHMSCHAFRIAFSSLYSGGQSGAGILQGHFRGCVTDVPALKSRLNFLYSR